MTKYEFLKLIDEGKVNAENEKRKQSDCIKNLISKEIKKKLKSSGENAMKLEIDFLENEIRSALKEMFNSDFALKDISSLYDHNRYLLIIFPTLKQKILLYCYTYQVVIAIIILLLSIPMGIDVFYLVLIAILILLVIINLGLNFSCEDLFLD